jgi:hypothetical protein
MSLIGDSTLVLSHRLSHGLTHALDFSIGWPSAIACLHGGLVSQRLHLPLAGAFGLPKRLAQKRQQPYRRLCWASARVTPCSTQKPPPEGEGFRVWSGRHRRWSSRPSPR